MKLKALASALWMGAKKHSPEILVGLGIAGAASSVIFAIKATPKAMILLEEKRQELGVEKLEAKEIIKTAAPVYIPTAVSFGVSVACIIGASSVNARRNAALTAAYTLSESTLRTYRDKVLETVGEDKEREIRQAAAIEQQQKTPETQTVVVNHAAGQLKCFDSLSGRSTCIIFIQEMLQSSVESMMSISRSKSLPGRAHCGESSRNAMIFR